MAASNTHWPDVLEEEAYLVQLISESPPESGTLEQATNTLNILRADLYSCTSELVALERDIRGNTTVKTASSSTSASHFFHRIPESISLDHIHDEKEHEVEAQNERLNRAAVRQGTLKVEIRNLGVMIQMSQRRIRHHEELKQKLKALYDRVFNGPTPSSPEEEEAEKEVQKAQQMLCQSQKTTEHHRTLVALLRYGDFVLSAAGPRFSAAVSREGNGADSKAVRTDIIAAKNSAVLASIVIDQAMRLDPSLEERKGGDFFRTDWLSSVFRTRAQGSSHSHHSSSISPQQVLQSSHTALLSLLNVTREKYRVHETNLRHAARWYAEAYVCEQMVRRRHLLKYTGVGGSDLQLDSGGSRAELAQTRDLTAGLDKLITVAFPSEVYSPQSGVNEEKNAGMQGERNPPKQDRTPPLSVDSSSPSSQSTLFESSLPAPTLVFGPSPRSKRSPVAQLDTTASQQRLSSGGLTQSRVTVARNVEPSINGSPTDMRAEAGHDAPHRPASHIASSAPATRQRRDHRPHPSDAQSVAKMRAVPAEAAVVRARVLSAQPTSMNGAYVEDIGPHANHNQLLPKDPQTTLGITNMQSAKRAGILKTPAAVAGVASPVTPRFPGPAQSPPEHLADAWGVKIASAGSSRPLPKLKKIIGLLRVVDGFKPSNSPGSHANIGSGSPRSPHPHALEVAQAPSNLRSDGSNSSQKLRFSETVDLIPRNAVDSDPYEDEDDSDDCIPPSPKRGSLLWRTMKEEEREDSEESNDNCHKRVPQPAASHGFDMAPGKREAAVAGFSAENIQEELGFHICAPATNLLASDSDSGSAGTPHPPQETNASAQNLVLNVPEAFTKHVSHQTTLDRMDSESGAPHKLIGGWPRRNTTQTTGTHPDKSSAPRPSLEQDRTSSDNRQADRKKLAVLDDTDPMVILQKSVPPMGRGGPIELRSDHDLVRAIFPSPRSTVAESDLLFTKYSASLHHSSP